MTNSSDQTRPEQEPTVGISAKRLMASVEFAQGVTDRRTGAPPAYDAHVGWEYEYGRAWASLAPLSMPLKIHGKLNPMAICLFEAAYAKGLII